MLKGYVDHHALGRVIVTINPRARRFTARWKDNHVALTIPVGADLKEINQALDSMTPGLMSRRPALRVLRPGAVITMPDFEIRIEEGSRSIVSGQILPERPERPLTLLLFVHPAMDAEDVETGTGSVLRKMARRIAAPLLLPRAKEIATRLGISGVRWQIGHGVKRLGSCSAQGLITLSSFCVFLPWRLREYIICHELAHLTHFDHSPAFHALCSRYCGGDGEARRNELKHYAWPVPRR